MIDTTKQGFEYIGVHLTDEQYNLIQCLNAMMITSERQNIPAFNMIVLLKVLNILPPEMCEQPPREEDFDDFTDYIQAIFGRKE